MQDLDRHEYCYLTTVGRVTGRPHRIEIWFAQDGATIHLLSGGDDRADWVRNLLVDPAVEVEVGGERFAGTARLVEDSVEAARARRSLYAKYAPGYDGDLRRWRDEALPVAVDLVEG